MEYLELFLKYAVAGAGMTFGLIVVVGVASFFKRGYAKGGVITPKQSADGLQAFKEGLANAPHDGQGESMGPKTIFQGKKPN